MTTNFGNLSWVNQLKGVDGSHVCIFHRDTCKFLVIVFQIIPPHDQGISSLIEQNLEPWPSSWDTGVVETSDLRKDPFKLIHDKYMTDLKKVSYYRWENIWYFKQTQ